MCAFGFWVAPFFFPVSPNNRLALADCALEWLLGHDSCQMGMGMGVGMGVGMGMAVGKGMGVGMGVGMGMAVGMGVGMAVGVGMGISRYTLRFPRWAARRR